jgi:multidrug efflux pump subunit AcrA (membrane-fusion protein)
MFKNRWILLIIIVLVAVGGYYGYNAYTADANAAVEEPAMQTAKVRTGDLILYANGTGFVSPAAEASFGFRSSGQVAALSASVGDTVMAGDLLAELDNTAEQVKLRQAERTLAEMTTPLAVANAEQELALAENALIDARNTYIYQISPAVYEWENRVAELSAELASAEAAGSDITDIQTKLDYAEKSLASAHYTYTEYYVPETFTIAATRFEPAYLAAPSEMDIRETRAAYAAAQQRVVEAQYYLAALNGEEIPNDAWGTELAKLEDARLAVLTAQDALDATRLYAPIDGTVLNINASFGDTVSTSSIITIASTDDLLITLYMDETDVDKALVGNKTQITFDAFPDVVLDGEILSVEKALQTVDGTPVIVSLVDFDPAGLPLLSGMSADVEIIGGEAIGALLVPIQALREVAPGSYAVFVVDGEDLKLTPVKVGLRDFANAEILSGLEAGDIVSTGVVETKDE